MTRRTTGLTYTLTGTDAAAFTIVTSTGQLRTSEALDFETKSSYSFTLEVHDGRDGSGNTSTTIDDTQAVTITVENVEEPGTITLTTDTGTIQARVGGDGGARGRRHSLRRHLAVGALAERQDPLGQHRRRNVRHVHANAGGGPRQLHPRDGVVHRRPRPEQDCREGIGARGRPSAGELGAGVPVVGGRAARSGGELRGRIRKSGHPSPPPT